MELKDTIELMQSDNFVDRFKAEYYQTLIRRKKLTAMLDKYRENTLEFTPRCNYDILKEQETYMIKYLHSLEFRAEIEGIGLEEI